MKSRIKKCIWLVAALVLAFALTACGGGKKYPPADNAGDAIGGSAVVMADKDNFTVSTQAKLTLPALRDIKIGALSAGFTTVSMNGDVAVSKTASGYDYNAALTATPELALPVSVPVYAVKKDNIQYLSVAAAPVGSARDWQTSYAADIDVSLTSLAAEIKNAIAGMEYGGFEKEEDGYSLTFAVETGTQLKAVQEFVRTYKDVAVGDFLTADTPGYDAAALGTDLAAVLADDNTLQDTVTAVDALLAHAMGDDTLTVQMVADAFLTAAGIDAYTVYELLTESGEAVDRPSRGETAYAYFLKVGGDYALSDVVALIGENGVSLQELRTELVSCVTDETFTVGDLIDRYAAAYDADARAYWKKIGYPEKIDGYVLSAQNLTRYTIGEVGTTAVLRLNKDLSVKNIALSAQADVRLGDEKVVDVQLSAIFGFSYNGGKKINAPSVGTVAPCILHDEVLDIYDLPASGAYSVDYYAGIGYATDVALWVNGEQTAGVTAANGKLTLSSDAVAAVRLAGQGTLTLTATAGDKTVMQTLTIA